MHHANYIFITGTACKWLIRSGRRKDEFQWMSWETGMASGLKTTASWNVLFLHSSSSAPTLLLPEDMGVTLNRITERVRQWQTG